jgi:hypothetical protein
MPTQAVVEQADTTNPNKNRDLQIINASPFQKEKEHPLPSPRNKRM